MSNIAMDNGPFTVGFPMKNGDFPYLNYQRVTIIYLENCVHVWYPLVNIEKIMDKSTMLNGKTHHFDWAMFNSSVANCQVG